MVNFFLDLCFTTLFLAEWKHYPMCLGKKISQKRTTFVFGNIISLQNFQRHSVLSRHTFCYIAIPDVTTRYGMLLDFIAYLDYFTYNN